VDGPVEKKNLSPGYQAFGARRTVPSARIGSVMRGMKRSVRPIERQENQPADDDPTRVDIGLSFTVIALHRALHRPF